MERTRKAAIRWYADFDREEEWLNRMSRKGWALYYTNGTLYLFSSCEPGASRFQVEVAGKKASSGEDYVSFRAQCGDELVTRIRNRLYWKRDSSLESTGEEDSLSIRLHRTEKSLRYHLGSPLGLTLIASAAFLVAMPLARLLPESDFSSWLFHFSGGLTYGILAAETLILLPLIWRLRKRMEQLMNQLF